jgi:hypothetical protein
MKFSWPNLLPVNERGVFGPPMPRNLLAATWCLGLAFIANTIGLLASTGVAAPAGPNPFANSADPCARPRIGAPKEC